jgi:hypothetical protein
MALEAPGRSDSVLQRTFVPGSEIGNDHHVLGEPGWHREDGRALVKQHVADLERDPHRHVHRIELAGDQPPPVLPTSGAARGRASDTSERSRQLIERVRVHARQFRTHKSERPSEPPYGA